MSVFTPHFPVQPQAEESLSRIVCNEGETRAGANSRGSGTTRADCMALTIEKPRKLHPNLTLSHPSRVEDWRGITSAPLGCVRRFQLRARVGSPRVRLQSPPQGSAAGVFADSRGGDPASAERSVVSEDGWLSLEVKPEGLLGGPHDHCTFRVPGGGNRTSWGKPRGILSSLGPASHYHRLRQMVTDSSGYRKEG
jgi:hypothetical protein